jgi:SAM-dependent methyltransferase
LTTDKAAENPHLPAAKSITHLHVLACVNTKLADQANAGRVRILDVGCGDGELIAYLLDCLPALNPGIEFELHGLDVTDSSVQPGGFFEKTLHLLDGRQPGTDWRNRLSLVTSTSRWPYEDGYFDIIVSNQVLEHVADHDHLFREIRRTLREGGSSIHLFPLIHYLQEGHIHIPLAHRIRRHGLLRSYIKFMSRLGFGSFRAHRDAYGMTLDHYAEEHADYLTFMTNYLSAKALLAACKRAGLRSDFSFTSDFYQAKLRSMLRRPARYRYAAPRPWRDAAAFFFLKRISSITLTLEKKQIYAR